MGSVSVLYDRLPAPLQSAAITAKGWTIARSRFGAEFRKKFQELRTTQWRSAEEWSELQRSLLIDTLRSAQRNVPHYESLLLTDYSGMSITEILKSVPLSSKSDILNNPLSFLSRNRPRRGLVRRKTSGTTGSSLSIISSPESAVIMWSAMARFWSWAGVRHGERRVSFTGNEIVPLRSQSGHVGRIDRANNRLLLSVYHLSDATVDRYIDTIERYQPAFIDGYPSAMAFIARRALERGRRLSIPACFPTSEMLTPDVRRVIEEGFQTRVFNQYGSQEWATMVAECPAGRLHVNPEIGVVEILNSDGSNTEPGGSGDLVVTGLIDHVMPFIRYKIGDIARVEDPDVECECGRSMPLVSELIGRQDDVVTTPDGRRIGMLGYNVFKHGENIREAQIIQKQRDVFVMNVVPGPDFVDLNGTRLIEVLKEIVGQDVTVDLVLCETLPPGSKGKRRSVVSLVNE